MVILYYISLYFLSSARYKIKIFFMIPLSFSCKKFFLSTLCKCKTCAKSRGKNPKTPQKDRSATKTERSLCNRYSNNF